VDHWFLPSLAFLCRRCAAVFHAPGGDRTHKGLLPTDFKSVAFASFATGAQQRTQGHLTVREPEPGAWSARRPGCYPRAVCRKLQFARAGGEGRTFLARRNVFCDGGLARRSAVVCLGTITANHITLPEGQPFLSHPCAEPP
jgi:hypothetical protein